MSKIDTTPDQSVIAATSEGVGPAPAPWRHWLAAFYCFDATTSLLFTSTAMIVLFPLFGLGITQVAHSTVYLWTLEGLITGSIAIGILVWILKRRT